MSQMKTVPTGASVGTFLAGVEPERRRRDGQQLDQLFRDATGFAPQMWGPGIVGYGRYDYTYASGYSGSFLATGFARANPRSASISCRVMQISGRSCRVWANTKPANPVFTSTHWPMWIGMSWPS